MLKRVVKVSNVTNLSVARYCAGMFVDMIQINVDEANEHYLEINRFKEIRGWLSGIKIVIETQEANPEVVKNLIELYQADYFLSKNEGFLKSDLNAKLIFEGDLKATTNIDFDDFQYFQFSDFDENNFLKLSENQQSKLIYFNQNELKNTLESIDKEVIKAYNFEATKEIRPGFQDFDELMEILEYLDE